MANIKTEADKREYLNVLLGGLKEGWLNDKESTKIVRRKIREIWGLKKSAANEKFRKLFDRPKPEFPTIAVELRDGQMYCVEDYKGIKAGEPVSIDAEGKVYSMDFKNDSKIIVADKPYAPLRGLSSEGLMVKDFEKLLNNPETGGFKREIKTGFMKDVVQPTGGFKVNGDKATLEIKNAGEIRTLEDLVAFCKVDLNKWEPKSFVPSLQRGVLNLRAEFKKRLSDDTRQIIDELKDDALNFSPNVDRIEYKAVKEGKLLVIAIMDAHLGRLSSSGEVSHNYDIKIAREIYLKTLYDLIDKAKKQGDIEKIYYIIGNDYLTIDGDSLQTTAGTDQDTDGRFPKIYREARKLLVETVEILTQIAPVDVVTVYGNHERSSMFHLGDAVQCWFRNNANVKVDNVERLRKYYKWKDIVIATTHGDTIKHDKLVTMGLVEFGPEWGAAKRRFWLLGHQHHLKCVNLQGTELWTFPSICGSDGYHQAHGYVGSTRNGLAMIFSKDNLEAVFQSQPVEDRDY